MIFARNTRFYISFPSAQCLCFLEAATKNYPEFYLEHSANEEHTYLQKHRRESEALLYVHVYHLPYEYSKSIQ